VWGDATWYFYGTSFQLILRNKICYNYSLNFSDINNIHRKLFPKQFSINYYSKKRSLENKKFGTNGSGQGSKKLSQGKGDFPFEQVTFHAQLTNWQRHR